ncbi:hypothetical protein ACTHO0_15080 [Cytobacillus praedii]|jgi:hypothetical protein|uniref:Uncharacterized protein n=1 Tax=Cytobacillus praedii TaxID=1742358 RepID=A0A4R1B1P2_9BACI|nr:MULTISPECIES: hypothetical protein [Cytobacillus]MED3573772.1 hypothetical protein [Cytobacillus praedii]TCJ04770.1 hypothetical protein E0Y62_08190 [Cytobacillus praedii]
MTKGLVFINQLQLNYTSDMEKAMHGAHGVGYETYSRKHEVRMKVEKRRQEEHIKCQQMIANLEKKVHS